MGPFTFSFIYDKVLVILLEFNASLLDIGVGVNLMTSLISKFVCSLNMVFVRSYLCIFFLYLVHK